MPSKMVTSPQRTCHHYKCQIKNMRIEAFQSLLQQHPEQQQQKQRQQHRKQQQQKQRQQHRKQQRQQRQQQPRQNFGRKSDPT